MVSSEIRRKYELSWEWPDVYPKTMFEFETIQIEVHLIWLVINITDLHQVNNGRFF